MAFAVRPVQGAVDSNAQKTLRRGPDAVEALSGNTKGGHEPADAHLLSLGRKTGPRVWRRPHLGRSGMPRRTPALEHM
ncbi:hypothetical protein GCM10009872_07890 [Actinopolymorpha rutila]